MLYIFVCFTHVLYSVWCIPSSYFYTAYRHDNDVWDLYAWLLMVATLISPSMISKIHTVLSYYSQFCYIMLCLAVLCSTALYFILLHSVPCWEREPESDPEAGHAVLSRVPEYALLHS